MTPKDLLVDAIDPAHAMLERLAGVKSDNRARVLSLAIAGQESAWAARRQGGGGPARSYWQFEGRGGGVGEVFAKTPKQLSAICTELDIPFDIATVFEAMAWNDVLAASMARLLLWQDPKALPAVGSVEEGWQYYLSNWRPGAPHPGVWPGRYGTAMGLVNNYPMQRIAA